MTPEQQRAVRRHSLRLMIQGAHGVDVTRQTRELTELEIADGATEGSDRAIIAAAANPE